MINMNGLGSNQPVMGNDIGWWWRILTSAYNSLYGRVVRRTKIDVPKNMDDDEIAILSSMLLFFKKYK